jgi:nitrate/nitrite transporter NarK
VKRATPVALVMLCQSTQALVLGGLALFLPLIRTSFGISFAQAGSLSAVSLLVYAFMQVPAGYLADRIGPKRLFVVGLVATNVLAFTFAHLHSYTLALLNQAAAGFFRSLVFAPGLLLISALFPADRRATAMGLYVAAGFSSNFFLNLLGPVLVGRFGWRTLFSAFSLFGLLIIVLFSRFGATDARPKHAEPMALRHALTLFRRRAMWLIAAIQYVRFAVVTGVTVWIPSFIVYDRGHSLRTAGLVVALGAVLTAPSNFLGGYLADRLRNPLLVIGGALTALTLGLVALAHVHDLVPLMAVVAFLFVFIQIYFGPLFALPIELFGTATAGLSSGFSNLFANLGGFTFALTLGWIKDATGSFAAGFYALAALSILGLACVLLLATGRRASPAVATM